MRRNDLEAKRCARVTKVSLLILKYMRSEEIIMPPPERAPRGLVPQERGGPHEVKR